MPGHNLEPYPNAVTEYEVIVFRSQKYNQRVDKEYVPIPS